MFIYFFSLTVGMYFATVFEYLKVVKILFEGHRYYYKDYDDYFFYQGYNPWDFYDIYIIWERSLSISINARYIP